MYGNLIGYYFNKKFLPWDDDIDLILVENSIKKLDNYNGSDYVIEVNPFSDIFDNEDINNHISARVISKRNGCFIDVTFLIEKNGYLFCKDGNKIKKKYILPDGGEENLRQGLFEDIKVYIPNNIRKCLEVRYGKQVFNYYYNGYHFNLKEKKWYKIKR